MKRKITIIALILASFITISAQKEVKSHELNEVQIEANRIKIYPDAGRIVKVIDKTEIEKLPVQNLDELLDKVAGLDARQRGTGGVQTDLSIRGGSFDQVLVLLNGVNITDPQTGHYNLDIPLELNDISRIEILQGSAARVYGPNAFSGAINIVTSETNKNQLAARNQAGSYGTIGQNVSANYFSEAFQTFGSVSYRQSDGFIPNTDYKTTNAFWQSKINAKNTGFFRFQIAVQFKEYGANGFYSLKYPNQFESTKSFLSSLEWNLERNFYSLNAQVYWRRHHDRFELFRNFEGAEIYPWYKGHNYHQTDIAGGKVAANFDWKAYGKTTLGIDVRNEHIFSNVLGKPMETPRRVPFEDASILFTYEDNRLLPTILFDHTVNVEKWNLSGGISTTFNKEFGTQTNGGIDIGYKPNAELRVFAALNSAVRLPTFTDLYYKSATQIANPDLKPEKSLTLELGGKYGIGNLASDAVVYHRWGKNVIDWIKKPEETKWQSANLTNVNAFGTDINVNYQFQQRFLKSVSLAYSFLNLDKKATGYDSKYALDYLRNKIVVGLNHTVWNKLSAGWNVSWNDRAGNYTDFYTNQLTDYKPYTLLNLRLMWNSKNVDVNFDCNNLLNREYEEFGGLAQPKINFMGGITIKI